MLSYNNTNHYNNMIFHMISKDILEWMQQWPDVKEESITDRLLFDSKKTKRFFAKAFTRIEEADNGADWEWWVIVNTYKKVFAYRFLIQAKKIKKETTDCYSQFNYKNGNQLQDLLNASYTRKAMPLYMVYSVEKQDLKKIHNNCEHFKIRDMLLSCENCENGAYLTPAYVIEELIKRPTGKKIAAEEIINKSLKLSFLDFLMPVENSYLYHINRPWRSRLRYLEYMEEFPENIMWILAYYFKRKWWIKNNCEQELKEYDIPFRYSLEQIPDYVRTMMFEKERDYEHWYEKEHKNELEGLAGVAILDLRNSEGIPEE